MARMQRGTGDCRELVGGAARKATTVLVALALACSSDRSERPLVGEVEDVGEQAQALTLTERILHFEGSVGANGDWSAVSGNAAASTFYAAGSSSKSLALGGDWNPSALSKALGALGPLAGTPTIKVRLPSGYACQGQYCGQVALFISCPSANILNDYVGPASLHGPASSFQHYALPALSAGTQQALSSRSDCRVRVQLNLSNPGAGAVQVDLLSFGQGSSGGGTGGSGGGGTAGAAGSLNGGTGGGSGTAAGGSGGSNGGTAGASSSGTSGASGSAGAGAGGVSGASGAPGSLQLQFFIDLPNGVTREAVALATSGGALDLRDAFKVRSGSAGFASVSSVKTTAQTRLGVAAETQHVWSEAGAFLANNAAVHGNLTTEGSLELQAGAHVDGATAQAALLDPIKRLAWTVEFPPPGQGPTNLEPQQSATLVPGSYAGINLKTGAVLTLATPGRYTFHGSIVLEPGSTLDVDNRAGSIELYATGGLTQRGQVVPRDANRNNLLIGVAGTTAVSVESGLRSILVAPYADVTLATVSGHRGSVFARSIRAEANTSIQHEPFDDATCASGAICDGRCPCDPGQGPCSDNGGCVGDVECTGAICGGPGAQCESNEECAPGSSCRAGKCDDGGTCATCDSDLDCKPGLVCGKNNGGYCGTSRATRVCWAPSCEDGVEASQCGTETSECGTKCGDPTPCDPAQPLCPPGEVCKPGLGPLFGVSAPAVCVPPSCPSNDEQECGAWDALCGKQCICTPDCSHATAANPSDGCGGQCPGVCPLGGACCSLDVHCPVGAACIAQTSGPGICRDRTCAYRHVEPPLCGHAGALCGETCPVCTPACGNRECGVDPQCGASCGSCDSGELCTEAGQCVAEVNDPAPTVEDGTGETVPVAPLPAGASVAAGALAGGFSVSEQGTAQYTVPIDVPPGRAGMQPALSLVYAGPRVEGTAGAGWKLEGLSQITRCPRVFALDGYPAPIKNDATDRFCIDGKRLETIAGSSAYGADGAEYRTLIDTFTKVVSRSSAPVDAQGPEWFEVWTKDGRILTYGKTRDALILTGNGVRNAWLLQRVEDRSGNNMIVRYRNERLEMPAQLPQLAASVVVPASIFYTGSHSIEGDREVRFDYDARLDSVTRFVQGGVPLVAQYRLSRITTHARGTAVKTYRLEYESEARSQLKKIYECAGIGDTCRSPTEFGYIQDVGFDAPVPSGAMGAGAQLDINGDGIPDYLSTTALVDGVAADPTATAAFVTADVAIGVGSMFAAPGVGIGINFAWTIGKVLIFDALQHAPTITYSTDISIGTKLRSGSFQYVQASGYPCPGNPSFFLDYDRDGKDDVVASCPVSVLGFARSVGDGTFTNRSDLALPYVPRWSSLPRPTFLDVNGDALEDLLYCADASTLRVRLARPNLGFATDLTFAGRVATRTDGGPFQERIPYCADAQPIYSVNDVDGDGTPELMALYTPTRNEQLVFSPSSPAGAYRKQGMYALRLGPPTSSGPRVLAWEPVDVPNIGTYGWGGAAVTGDFNGDGLVDVANSYGEELKLWLNTSGGFQLQRVPHPRPALDRFPDAMGGAIATLDYNGDGRVDLLERWRAGGGDLLNVQVQPFAAPAPRGTILDEIGFDGPNGRRHARVDVVRDLDGDGNVDLATNAGLFYGKGLRNGLLSTVTDGLGNSVRVDYFDAYKASCSTQSGSQWPEKCLKNIKGLVSGYRTGLNVRYPDGTGTFAAERSYTYSYENARVSMTGHGWLGFEKVTMKETSGPADSIVKTTTTQFEPPVRYHTAPGVPASSVEPPYVYPLAGLPRYVTVDETQNVSDPLQSLEDAPHLRRTEQFNEWTVAESADNRPYPRRRLGRTETLSCDLAASGTASSQACATRTWCEDFNYSFDGYGNVTSNDRYCKVPPVPDGESQVLEAVSTTIDTFTHDRATWLIEHPKNVRIEAFRYPSPSVQVQEYAYHYDGLGRPALTVRDPNGQNEQSSVDYDEFGNVERFMRVAPGHGERVTLVTYGADHVLPLSIENAEGHVTQVRFSPTFGQLETLVDPNGVVVQHAYDGFGRRTLSVTPSGSTTYDLANSLATYIETGAGEIHPRLQIGVEQRGTNLSFGGRTEQLLDSHGRVVRSTTIGLYGVEVSSDRVFDARGRVVATTAPRTATGTLASTTYEYDFLDRPTKLTLPDGSVAEHRYASSVHLGAGQPQWLNQLRCPQDAVESCGVDIELATEPHLPGEAVRQTVIVRDFNGQVVRTFDGENVSSAAKPNDFEYQPFGRLSQLLDNQKTATTFRHDPYGRLTSHRDPDSGERTYTYTGFGELETSFDPKAQLRTFRYDRLGRLTKVIDGSVEDAAHTTRWLYDLGATGLGQLAETISPATAASPGGQRVRYSYYPPSAGQHRGQLESLTHVIDGTEYQVGLHYDDLGRTRQIDYPDLGTGTPIKALYGYDQLSGALTSLSEIGGNATRPIWSLTDAFEGVLPAGMQFGNGASSTLTYDPQRYTLDTIQTRVDGNVIQNLGYHRLANGQIDEHSSTRNGQLRHFAYQYDPLGRLEQTTETFPGQPDIVQNYGYDERGNLTNLAGKAITFTNPLQPHLPNVVGNTTYGHDANGNLTSRTGFEVPGFTQLINHTPFDLPSVIATGDSVTTLDYTADERRVVRRDPSHHRHFAGDLYERVVSPGGATEQERFRLSAGGGVVAEITRSPTDEQTLYLHPDALGTPETITDPLGAAYHQDFDPFGGRRTGDTSLTRLGFTGHHQDDDLGLIDMAGRVYDPLAGRFTTADPILQAPFSSQGQNRYAYVFNDPVNMTDPSGFAWQDTGSTGGNVAWGVGAAAWGGAAVYAASSASGFSLSGLLAGGSGPGVASGGLGLGLNTSTTLLMNPFGGSPESRYTAPVPSAVSNSSPVKPGGADAVGQAAGTRPLQERADQLQESIEDFDEAHDERLAMRGARRRPRGAPMPGGGGPVLRPMPPQPRIPVLLPRLAPGRSFPSHRAFVNWAGRAGDGMSWHHIVEQNEANVARFGAARIHTTGNYYRLSNHVHSQINEFYSKPNFALTGSRTMTVRQWIAPQSYENHQTLGEFALQLFLGQ